MNVYYEKEEFMKNKVPIRLFYHDYTDSPMFTVNHWHRSVELDLTLEGSLTHIIDGETVVCGPGEYCIVNSGAIHSNHSDPGFPTTRAITLQIALSFLNEWFGEDVVYRVPESEEDRDTVKEVLLQFAEESRSQNNYHELRKMELLYRLLDHLSGSLEKKDSRERSRQDGMDRFKEVLDYIEQHYREELSLELLADRFGYSPTYLSRSFKKNIGYNFSEHLQMIRLNATLSEMRAHPEKSILDCSMEHGFPNVKAFIHIFKKEYGCTPSEWRKNYTDGKGVMSSVFIDSTPAEFIGFEEMYTAMQKE